MDRKVFIKKLSFSYLCRERARRHMHRGRRGRRRRRSSRWRRLWTRWPSAAPACPRSVNTSSLSRLDIYIHTFMYTVHIYYYVTILRALFAFVAGGCFCFPAPARSNLNARTVIPDRRGIIFVLFSFDDNNDTRWTDGPRYREQSKTFAPQRQTQVVPRA